MRRIFGLLAAAVLIWLVVRHDASPIATSNTPSAPVASRDAPTPDISSGAERNPASDASAQSVQPVPARTNSAPHQANSGQGFRDRAHLDEHFAKHGGEFPGLSAAQYLAMAQTLRDAVVGADILEITRASDGVTSRFDRRSGAFLAFDRDGTIRTFFKPNDGEKYFRRQANRAPAR